jgi:hypothetical protein
MSRFATDSGWRSATIVLRGLLEQVPEQRSDKKLLLDRPFTIKIFALKISHSKNSST